MNEEIEIDTSFSGIVSQVDRDPLKGKHLIINLANEYFETKGQIKAIEAELVRLKFVENSKIIGIQHTMDHLKLKKPLAVSVDEGFIVISENAITLETNVI